MYGVRRFLISLSAVGFLAMTSATAHADTITIVGSLTGNLSTATVECQFNSQTNTLTVTITSGAAFTGFNGTEICNAIFVRFQNVPVTPRNNEGSDVVPRSAVPEPSTFALAGLGAAALLIFRRRK